MKVKKAAERTEDAHAQVGRDVFASLVRFGKKQSPESEDSMPHPVSVTSSVQFGFQML
ncbi:hypothetical protein [Candidatus Amarobacter glycogenicus]|uniref:hypothetical protein n=1 Tax=Candidatus Amarobacter glycogenicus TaxID=3140699 RepID=UPI003136DAA7|nr:hypothetical protein [Dehalococcoidia bacterium]